MPATLTPEQLSNLQAGQEFYYVSKRGTNCVVTVTKVGSKYFHTSNDKKWYLSNGVMAGEVFGNYDCLYINKEYYEEESKVSKLWGELRKAFIGHGGAPAKATSAALQEILDKVKAVTSK